MLLVLDGRVRNSETILGGWCDEASVVVSLTEEDVPVGLLGPRTEVRSADRYEYYRVCDGARRLACDWSAGGLRALLRSQVPLCDDGVNHSSALESRLYVRLLPEATACLRLMKILEMEHSRPVVIKTGSRLRARLFERLLSDRQISHRVVRELGPWQKDFVELLRPLWRPVRDLVRALMLRREPSTPGCQSCQILVPELSAQVEKRVAGLLAELNRRGLKVTILGVKARNSLWQIFRTEFLSDAKAMMRAHSFLVKFWWRASRMAPIDVLGEVVLPQRIFRAVAGDLLYQIVMQAGILQRAVKALQPELLLYTQRWPDHSPSPAAYYSVGRHLGVPTMWLQLTELLRLEPLSGIEADRLMVLGEAYKERFIAAGVPEEAIAVIGSDHYVPSAGTGQKEARARVAEDLGLSLNSDDEKLIFFASSPERERNPASYRRLVLSSVAAAVSQLPHMRLVVKLHPQTPEDDVQFLRGGPPIEERLAVTRDYSIETLLDASDAVLVQWSTVGLQAIARRKPVLVLHYTGGAPEVSWPAEGAAIHVDDPACLAQAIHDALWDESTRELLRERGQQFLQRYLFTNDGRAWERVADAVSDVSRVK